MYFEILEHLNKQGLFKETDITKFFSKVVDIPWSNKEEQISNFLEYMNDSGHINCRIENRVIKASLLLMGFEYLRAHQVREQTIKSLKNQFRYNLITWGIAIVTIGVSIYTIDQNIDLSQRVRLIEQAKQQPKSQQHSAAANGKTQHNQK